MCFDACRAVNVVTLVISLVSVQSAGQRELSPSLVQYARRVRHVKCRVISYHVRKEKYFLGAIIYADIYHISSISCHVYN